LACKGQPVSSKEVHLRISIDGFTPNMNEKDIKITNGKAFASAVLSEPGFLNGHVNSENADKAVRVAVLKNVRQMRNK
jgi:hypothetical protein